VRFFNVLILDAEHSIRVTDVGNTDSTVKSWLKRFTRKHWDVSEAKKYTCHEWQT